MRLTLNLTHQCNLACTYCYAGKKYEHAMTEETGRRAIEAALAETTGRLDLLFFGGEPLLAWDRLCRLAEYAAEAARARRILLRLGVTTNGTLLDEAKARVLDGRGFHVGISIDGGPAAQDATRPFAGGQSSFTKVRRALDVAREHLRSFEVIAVVDPLNVRHLAASLDAILEAGSRRVTFNPNWGGAWRPEDLDPWRDGYEHAASGYIDGYRRGDAFRLNVFDDPIKLHIQGGWHENEGCRFDQGEWAVAPSGNIYPCGRAVGEDRDASIRVGHVDDARPDPRPAHPEAPPPTPAECAACALQPRCASRCGCSNREETGDPHQPGGILCWHERMSIPIADRIGATLFGERNPAFLARFYPGLSFGPADGSLAAMSSPATAPTAAASDGAMGSP